jgi:hypothetical protein
MRIAIVAIVLVSLFLVACGGGESKSENQVLEERAFEAHSEYLLAEAELLSYRSRSANPKYRRELRAETEQLLKECEAAVTEQECSVQEPLEAVVHEITEAAR